MKKKSLALLMAFVMLFSLVPTTVFAAASDNAIKIVLVKDSTTFGEKTVLRADFYAKTGSDTPVNQNVYLKYNATKVAQLAAATGADASSLLTNFSSSQYSTALTKNNYVTVEDDPILGRNETDAEVIVYAKANDDFGYIGWKVTEKGTVVPCFADYTLVSSIFFGLKEGTSFDAFPSDTIKLATPAADAAVTAQTNSASVTVNGSTTYFYGSTVSTNELAKPTIEAGDGVTFVLPALAGSVSVSGTAKVGETLTAVTTGITSEEPGTLSYRWYRGDAAISDATAATYTLTNDDIGKQMKVSVSAANYSGSLTSAATAAVTCKLSDVAVSLTAPVLGTAPETSVNGTGYTGTVTWDPAVSSKFAAKTAYTATVTLTAAENYTFASDAAPTVTGASISDKNVTDSNKTLTFKAAFDATADKTEPYVATAPTAKSIVYGDELSNSTLTGGSVLTKADGETVNGAWAWKEGTTVPKAGTNVQWAVFTPDEDFAGEYSTVEAQVSVTVNRKTLTNVAISDIAHQTYTGAALTPDITVTSGELVDSDKLTKDVDYTVTYASNTDVGSNTAKAIIVTKEGSNYTFTGPVEKTFTILAKNIAGATVTLDTTAQKYNGTAQTKSVTSVVLGEKTLTATTEYTVSGNTNTDAGEYTVTVTGTGNYTGTATAKYTIAKRAVTLTSATANKVYDNTALASNTVLVSGDGFVDSEGATYNVTGRQTTVGNSNNTFTYTLKEGTKADNYNITKVEGTLTVSQATTTITGLTLAGWTYGGTPNTPSATTNFGTPTYTYKVKDADDSTYTATVPTAAGEYTVKAAVAATTNYTAASATADFTIAKKSIAPTVALTENSTAVSGTTYTYDGNAKTPVVTVTYTDSTEKTLASSEYTVTYTNNTAAGTAKVTVAAKENGNFTFTEEEVTFTINKKNVTAPTADSTAFTYTGSEQTYTLATSDDYTITGNKRTNAGSQNVTVALNDKANTQWSGGGTDDKTYTFNIAKATPTKKTVAEQTVSFADTADKTLAVADLIESVPGTLTITGITGTDTILAKPASTGSGLANLTYALKSGLAKTDANKTATVTMEFVPTDTANYSEVDGITVTVKVVEKVTVSDKMTFADGALTFNGAGQKFETATIADEYTGTITYAYAAVTGTLKDGLPCSAGTYTVTATYEDVNNLGTKSATLTINAKTLPQGAIQTIAAQDYNFGAAITPTLTVKDGETVLASGTDYTVAYSNNTAAGTATATIIGKGNYTGTASETFTIQAISLAAATFDVAEAGAYTGSALTPAVSNVKLSGHDLTTSDYTVTYSDNVAAGTNTATVKLTGEGNFSGEVTKKFSIGQQSLSGATITLGTALTYTGSEQTQTIASVTVNGKTLTAGTDYTVTNNNGTNAGSYTLTITGAGNYSGSATKEFTIAKKALAKPTAAAVTSFVYDGTEKTYQPTGFDANTMNITGNKATVVVTDQAVTVTLKDTSNYEWQVDQTNPTFQFSITKKPVTAPAADTTAFVYNKTEQTYTLAASADYTVTNDKRTNAGSQAVTVALKDTTNTQWSDSTTADKIYTFTIAPKTLGYSAVAVEKVYDGGNSATITDLTLTGVISGDTVNLTYTKVEAKYIDTNLKYTVGTYPVEVTLTAPTVDNTNYQLPAEAKFTLSNVGIKEVPATEAVELEQEAGIAATITSLPVTKADGSPDPTAPAFAGFANAVKDALGGKYSDATLKLTEGTEAEKNVKRVQALVKDMAAAVKGSVEKSALFDFVVDVTKNGVAQAGVEAKFMIGYPAGTTKEHNFSLAHFNTTTGEIETVTIVKMDAGIMFTASSGSPFLLTWSEPTIPTNNHSHGYSADVAHTFLTDLNGINLVKVDGRVVDSKYYTISGTNVTLSSDYIKSLANGSHTIAIENATTVAKATFTVNNVETYLPTSGDGQTANPGALVKVTVDSGLARASAVYVDGVKLSTADYVITGKTVRLQGTYTKTLPLGYHTMTVVYPNGHTATARFVIAGDVVSAQTGDAGVMLYAAMALTSAAGAVWVTSCKKGKREEER